MSEVTGVPGIEQNAGRVEVKVAKAATPDLFYQKDATAGLVA